MRAENIIVAGAGQIGSRHLQALARSERPLRVEVVEPSAAARAVATERIAQVLTPGSRMEFIFRESVAALTATGAALAIVATTAAERPAVVSSLLARVNIRNMILEKVAYQSVAIFEQQIELLAKKGVSAWVNCPRRVYPFYAGLRDEIAGRRPVDISVSGSGWGLACNTIHYIDLLSFLTGIAACRADCFDADSVIRESRRPGFVEFTGRACFSNGGGRLTVSSYSMEGLPLCIDIASPGRRRLVFEQTHRVIDMNSANGFEPSSLSIRFPYQSELTHLIAAEIIDSGTCGLTPLYESYGHHALLLPLFSNHLASIQGFHTDICPVT